jgi:hypothetical protein
MYSLKLIGEITHVTKYVINANLEYQKVEDWNSISTEQVLYRIEEYYGKNCQSPYNYLKEYFWLNNLGIPLRGIKRDGWELHGFQSSNSNMSFKGIDPNGRIVNKPMGYHIQGIVNAIAFLDEVSQFNSWEQYQLLKENEALQAKLELLTQEKTKLQAMLDNSE